jgi:hypothetical protein
MSLLQALFWPWRFVSEVIDTHPTAGQIRQDLQQNRPIVVSNNTGVAVGLRLDGTDKVSPLEDVITRKVGSPEELPLALAFGEGVVSGYGLAVKRAINLRRSSLAEDNKLRRAALAADAAASEPEPASEAFVGSELLPASAV